MLLKGAGLFLIVAATAAAQSVPSMARGDSMYFAGQPAPALAMYDSLLARDSTGFDLLWHASRAALAVGILSLHEKADNPTLFHAESLARAATLLHPERVEGHYWLAAALGRRALHADLRTTIRLANAVFEAATNALAIDSMHAGANDVLGKLNSEIWAQPAYRRFFASHLLGLSVAKQTSWALAEHYLRRAVERDSTMILYRLDLGQMYVRTGRMAEARAVLGDVANMKAIHPPDELFRQQAIALLGRASSR